MGLTEDIPGINAPESKIMLSIDNGEKVFSSLGMIEGGLNELMKIVIIKIKRINFLIVVIFLILIQILIKVYL